MTSRWRFAGSLLTIVFTVAFASTFARQLSSRPAEDWSKSLGSPERIAALKLDELIAKLKVKPGDVVADLGAGPGVISVPLGKAVAPGGKVYAVEVDKGFLGPINDRAKAQNVGNVIAVLGAFTDPQLPTKDVDLALFHDVLHHVQDRAGYLKTLAQYIKPTGRIAVIDQDPKSGGHREDPSLQLTKEQVGTWMAAAGFKPVEEISDFYPNEWFVVYGRQ